MSGLRQFLLLAVISLCFSVLHGQLVDMSGCGSSKGCYAQPAECKGDACDYIATWQKDGNKVKFELQGKTEGWVAIGFSNDQGMGEDSVAECLRASADSLLVQTSYNPAKSNEALGTEALSDTSIRYESGFVVCSFSRDISSSNSKIFPLDQQYYLLLGGGPASGGAKGFHGDGNPVPSSVQVDVSSSVEFIGGGAVTSALLRAHGILMMSAWTLFVCTAIMLARYFKTGWPEKVLCDKKPVWFSMHRILNTSVLLMTVVAFVLIFIDVEGYTQNINTLNTAHPILGIIVTVLAIVNPVMALFRPHPDGERRYLFNWAHYAVGTIASILAVVNTYMGLSLNRSGSFVDGWVRYILLAFSAVYLITIIVLEVEKCMSKGKSDNMEMKAPGDMSAATAAPESKFRYVVFAMYMVFAVMLYLVMFIALLVN